MAKNVSTPKSMDRSASDSTPAGDKKLSPAPGGGKVRNISGPSINRTNKAGDLRNDTGVDSGTTVEFAVMSMGIRIPSYPLRFSSGTAFLEWLRAIGPDMENYPYPGRVNSPLKHHIAMYGKPIVRVPAERQVPNEARFVSLRGILYYLDAHHILKAENMLSMTNASKALFTRLEKVTAAVSPIDLKEGRPQNPFSTMHWTLESSPGGYTISMMRGGVIVAQKMLFRQDLFLNNDKGQPSNNVNGAAVDAIVEAMFQGIQVPQKDGIQIPSKAA